MVRFYLYVFLGGMQLTWTTWLAFVVARNGNPGWAEAAYHMAILLGEVPTGMVADWLGRRTSMLVGLSLGALSTLSYLFINDTFTACLVMGFSGLARTFVSGADEALLYETALQNGGREFARKAMARVSAINLAALSIAPTMAGLLYQWRDWAPFMGRSILFLMMLVVVWGLKEPAEARRPVRFSLWRQTADALKAIRATPTLLTLLVFGWLYNTARATVGQFGQAYFPAVGLSMGITGLVFSWSNFAATGGGTWAARIGNASAARWLRTGPLGVSLCFLTMGAVALSTRSASTVAGGLIGAIGFVLSSGLSGVILPIFQTRLNEEIPSAQRATILSLSGAGFSLCMSISFPLASYLPLPIIYLVTGGVATLLAGIWRSVR